MKQFIKDKIRTIINPMTSVEKTLINELRRDISQLPLESTIGIDESTAEWNRNRNKFRKYILDRDPRFFLTWDVIKNTMFVDDAGYIEGELEEIKNSKKFKTSYEEVLKEDKIGNPKKNKKYSASSGNLIHHTNHIKEFEEKTGKNINSIDLIFEFGGGYGSLCRAIHKLGFNGKYIIFDFEDFNYLQRYFLKSLGYEVKIYDGDLSENGVYLVNNMEKLKNLKYKELESLFIATWSISETSLEFRENFFKNLSSDFKNYLLAYQLSFNEADNVEFFQAMMKEKVSLRWENYELPYLKNSYYCFGF